MSRIGYNPESFKREERAKRTKKRAPSNRRASTVRHDLDNTAEAATFRRISEHAKASDMKPGPYIQTCIDMLHDGSDGGTLAGDMLTAWEGYQFITGSSDTEGSLAWLRSRDATDVDLNGVEDFAEQVVDQLRGVASELQTMATRLSSASFTKMEHAEPEDDDDDVEDDDDDIFEDDDDDEDEG